MRHLPYMHTPVWLGVRDGAIDVTPAAVGKVSEVGEATPYGGSHVSALAPKADICSALAHVRFTAESRHVQCNSVLPVP